MEHGDWDPDQDRAGGARGEGLHSEKRFDEYARLRREAPVAWTDRLRGYYTLTRYDDVAAAALDTERIRSGVPFVAMPDLRGQIPISLNPPEHQAFRRVLNRYFRPERMAALEPAIRGYAREHVADLLRAGEAEAMAAFCRPLPARALAALLNLPDDAWQELLAQFARFDRVDWDPGEVNAVILSVFAQHIGAVVAQRQADPLDPETDLLSGALAAEIGGNRLSEAEVVMIGVQMIAAGHATTAESLGSAVHRIATDPGLQEHLRANPGDLPTAIEEFLRLDPALHELGRTAVVDVELHGRTIPAGSAVGLNFAAANRDPGAFPDPDSLDPSRQPNRHLSFGHGIHKCLGAPLGRLELRVALEELLAATTSIELHGQPENDTGLIGGGFAALPVQVS